MQSAVPMYKMVMLISLCAAVFQSPSLNAQSALPLYDLEKKSGSTVELPSQLQEISGLAMTEDGRLFAHDDEKGIIYEVEYRAGKLKKSFYLGQRFVRADFEGLAIARDRFFLVSSSGDLYEFGEGKDGERVSYTIHRTMLTLAHDVEGLCYDPETRSLLLACKEYPGKGYAGSKAVYAFSLETMTLEKKPRFLLPIRELRRKSRHKLFNPSGIERHPETGTFFIIASEGESIAEVSPTGELLGQVAFPIGVHKQAEGITFAPDLSLLISNEGGVRRASLVIYPTQKSARPQ